MGAPQFTSSTMPVRKIKTVQFGLLSPEETMAMSVCRIEYPETFEDGKPKEGGLADLRLGTVERTMKCQTCGEDSFNCPGHFGHIELARPVMHVSLVNKIKKVLECVCFECGKLKVDDSDPRFARARLLKDKRIRFHQVWDLAKSKTMCEANPDEEGEQNGEIKKKGHGGCGAVQPKIRKEGLTLWAIFPKSGAEAAGPNPDRQDKSVISPSKIREVFKAISNEDCMAMGFNPEWARPEWMVITVLPVPPPQVRPSVSQDGTGTGPRSEDDLTHKLGDILKANQNLRRYDQENAPSYITREFEDLLQYHVATMVDNNIAGMPQSQQKSGRILKSIRQRLKGKEGRIRGNLMGKRVDFSARTVITGDPNISIDEVGVPRSVARTLTFPETVTPYNIDRLQEMVRNGANEYPGANHVIRATGESISLKYASRTGDIALQYGDKVERHLLDGDYVIFNRQPSLHKMSMMGHRVRVMPYSTFRLNLSVTSPYNADFDGDEMNLHAPQSYETRAEIRELCMVPKQIVSPQANKPVMGIVQDTLAGIRKFTLRDNFMTRDLVMNICMWLPDWDGEMPPPAILKPVPMWTGKQLMSLVIPKINVVGTHSTHPDGEKDAISPGDTRVIIEDGILLAGILCKKMVGSSAGGIIHVIMNEHGPEQAKRFFNGTQRVVNYWLLQNGFSIGIGDTIADQRTITTINDILKTSKVDVDAVVKEAQADKLECLPGMTIRETFESKVNKILNKARDDAGSSAQKSLAPFNNVKQMVVSGSKGSFLNISQMAACVGQQNVEGKRIPFGFRYRTLPHFTKDDYSPESRGFVENSYLRGLTPQEFFFHAMGGREGLIDTAVKTAETGYVQRRLVKALEDVMVKYDGTVRNSLGHVVQFAYGEDGMDGTGVERQSLDNMRKSNEELAKMYRLDLLQAKDRDWLARHLDMGLFQEIARDIGPSQEALEREWNQLRKDRQEMRHYIFRSMDSAWPLPSNVRRLIWNAQEVFHLSPNKKSDLTPLKIITEVESLLERCVVIPGTDDLSIEAQNNATLLWKMLIRSLLSVKRVLGEFYLNQRAFMWLLGEVETRFTSSKVHPGEMVGTIAAQSIGEPATQMTLNTFHYAGVSAKNVTLGVPRLKEIINVAKTIRTPSLTVILNDDVNRDVQAVKRVQAQLEHTTLRKIAATTEIYYDPDPIHTQVEADREWLSWYWDVEENPEQKASRLSPWVLRIQIDMRKKIDKGLTMFDIADRISKAFGEQDIWVAHGDDNNPTQSLVIRIVKGDVKQEDDDVDEELFLRKIEANVMNQLTLSGIDNINRVFITDRKVPKETTSTGAWGTETEYILETDGINLREVMAADNVKFDETYSNNPVEVLSVLGIEATRRALLTELRKVIEFDGSYVNYRHLALLCDVMCHKGYMMAITRHGINRSETGALARCSFEETVEILVEAASLGETDDVHGVSESIILGQLAPLGTGSFDVLLDEESLKSAPMTLQNISSYDLGYANGLTIPMTPTHAPMSPSQANYARSPAVGSGYGNYYGAASPMPVFSPGGVDGGMGRFTPSASAFTPNPYAGAFTPLPQATPMYSPTSPAYSPTSPAYSPTSPAGGGAGYSPTSPAYSPTSPAYSPTSPAAGGASYSPTSPAYSPTSPAYSPTSPAAGGASYSPTSPAYSPTSPAYSPTSPMQGGNQSYSPTSPAYSPTSPAYSPTSPAQQFNQSYSPTSPAYSPTSPAYSPTR